MEPDHPIHAQVNKMRNAYVQLIKDTKQEHWIQWLEDTSEESIWNVHRLVSGPSSDGGRTRIPNIKDTTTTPPKEATTNSEKSEMLHRNFFPPPPDLPTEYDETEYPEPVCAFRNITNDQVARAIDKLKPYKAVMENDLANIALKKTKDLIIPHLSPIYRATFTLRTYPAQWKTYDSIVLRKPGRTDYTIAKSYRPVVLLKTLGKPLSMAVAEDITYIAEKHQLLPPQHFGARPGRSAVDAVHVMVKYIKDAWRVGKVVSALFLDVKGAFPSVDTDRLRHNMRLKGIPREYTDWIMEKLTGRRTSIVFDDYRSQLLDTLAGLDQGCAISGPCYNFYNAPLLEMITTHRDQGEMSSGFIDDVALLARGTDFDEANAKLKTIMEKEGGGFDWAEDHNCDFEVTKISTDRILKAADPETVPTKKNATHTSPKPRTEKPHHPTIDIHQIPRSHAPPIPQLGGTIRRSASQRNRLGHPMSQSRQTIPRNPAQIRTQATLNGMHPTHAICNRRMGGTSPRKSSAERKNKVGGQLGKLAKVQRQALLLMGAMRTTATDILEAHANLFPFHLTLDKIRHRALLRMATLPETHPVHQHIRRAHKIHVKRHRSPLHCLLAAYKWINPDRTETIDAVRMGPKWKPLLGISIAPDKDEAKKEVQENQAEVKIFTDGSGYEGGIGAAAILLRRDKPIRVLRYHLGTEKQQVVYGGEMIGLTLGARLLQTENQPFRSVAFFSDSQAAIRATQINKPVPGHHLKPTLSTEQCAGQSEGGGRSKPKSYGYQGILASKVTKE
jgi:hypothetical protein